MFSVDIKTTLNTDVADAIIKRIEQHIQNDPAVKVGYFATGTHKDSFNKGQYSVAEVAYRNEIGARKTADEMGVIPRPFMRTTMLSTATFTLTRDGVRRYASDVFRNSKNADNKLNLLGKRLSKAMKATIDANIFPENHPSVVARKGFNHPLKGKTGALRNQIKYQISKRDMA